MVGPQSTLLFVLLVLAFAGLIWWIIRARRVIAQVIAAVLAFVVAVQFGILTVNKYFDYYQTWGAAIADLTGSAPANAAVPASNLLNRSWRGAATSHVIYTALARRDGYTLALRLTGPASHITRNVYVYLPPQYFRSAYRRYRFPVIELLHGQPGTPQDWINVVGVNAVLDNLVRQHLARPAVLVMPDTDGGQTVSLQCLNQARGPQDMTYLGIEVPDAISRLLRVQPPGPGWGLAGYSAGGYCAANMALQPQLRRRYGFAASLSGYFSPLKNQMPDGQVVDPFHGNKALRRANTPVVAVQALKPGTPIPRLWLGAGKGDRAAVAAAEYLWQELQVYQASVPLVLTPGQHSMAVWRAQMPRMLEWMTTGLAKNVLHLAIKAELAAKRARECAAQLPTARPAAHATRARPQPSATSSGQDHGLRSSKPVSCPAKSAAGHAHPTPSPAKA